MCARKASAEGFWICARYALDVFLAGLLIAALKDLTIIHDRRSLLADCAWEGYDDVTLMALCEIRYAPRVCAVYIYIYVKKNIFLLI